MEGTEVPAEFIVSTFSQEGIGWIRIGRTMELARLDFKTESARILRESMKE